MPDHAVRAREPAWGWAILFGIGLAYLVSIGFLLVLMWDLRKNMDVLTVRLPTAMLTFERSVGYGGLIHSFKNHVLRPGESRYARAAVTHYETAIQALDQVEHIAAETGLQIYTGEIRETLGRYRDGIDAVSDAHARGIPVAVTDLRVRIADHRALSDLRAAHDGISAALAEHIGNRKWQIELMIGVISLLMFLLPAGAMTMLHLRRQAERDYIAKIEALNAGLDRQNEKLAAANYSLSVSNSELNEFAHAAAHDLRTPLRGISYETDYMLDEFGDGLPQEVGERLLHVQALCGRLDSVMTLLLRYARLAPPSYVEAVDPRSVIDEIEAGMAGKLAATCGTIDVETELPTVGCKRFDLGMVFQKLIDNALTYNRSTEKQIAIGFLRRTILGDELLRDAFYVRDNGIGISSEHHDDVFRMFKRLHHDDAYGAGAGAGLSFVRKVVGNYGGIVRLVSEPGAGTTVYFSFCRQEGNLDDGSRARTPGQDWLRVAAQ